MFEQMEIAEYIYEGAVEPAYKKPTKADTNRDCISKKTRG